MNIFRNKTYADNLKLPGLLLVILFLCILVCMLMWNPYSLYFNRPEFSEIPYKRRELLAEIAAVVNLIILIWLGVISIIQFWRHRKFVVWTPLVLVATLLILSRINKLYPDSESEYTKDGYRFLEQGWYMGNERTFKRFKSEKPYESYSDDRAIIWKLDSIHR